MQNIRCPSCDRLLYIADAAPASLSCPYCLDVFVNPYQDAGNSANSESPPPLPVIPIDQQADRDQRIGMIGLTLCGVTLLAGIVSLFYALPKSVEAFTFILITLAAIVFTVLIVSIFFTRKQDRPPDLLSDQVQHGTQPVTAPPAGDVILHYRTPIKPQRKPLHPVLVIFEMIGGVIGGLMLAGGLLATGAPVLGLLVPITGIVLLFFRPVRGIGIGFILAIPCGILVIAGLCFGVIGR